nr:immunoglobulin heavy chain junction region [Mus musculus]
CVRFYDGYFYFDYW